jgi:sigma-B regulation protein RsbU (phosphoserine phosphatase)
MRTAARLLDDPSGAFAELNAELCERSQPSLVTIACALLRETAAGIEADVLLAGHPPPYHVHDGVARQVGTFASPLGAYQDGGWTIEAIRLKPGDQLILYTDGVIDTVGRGERFGEARLGDVLAQASGAADAIRRVDEALKEFAEGPQGDDTAVLALERVAAVAAEDVPSSLLIDGVGPAS